MNDTRDQLRSSHLSSSQKPLDPENNTFVNFILFGTFRDHFCDGNNTWLESSYITIVYFYRQYRKSRTFQ